MASSNRLVVEVVGDTTKLTRSLNQAQQQINRFAGKSKIRATGADALLADVRGLSKQADVLAQKQAAVEQRSQRLNASFARTGAGALATGFAINALGRNFQELGGNAGKLGNALNALSTGNIVGFVKGLQSINATDPAKMADDLVKFGSAAKATEAANKFAAAGFDDLARAANEAAKAINAAALAARTPISFSAISGGTFGIGTLDPLLGTSKKPGAGRKGITASQRNTFFDNAIARELDRAQDLAPRLQIQRLQEIRKQIEAKISQTKDRTRQLTLSDEIAQIDREVVSLNEGIAEGIRQKAKDLADARKKLLALFKSQADDIKSAVLDAFDTKVDKVHNAQDLKDAQKTLRQARQLGGAGSIETALRGVQDAKFAIARQRILDTRFSVGEGPRGPVNAVSVGNITFNITTSDPDKVASVVLKKLQLSNRHGSPQGRGRAPGAWTGLH